MCVAEFVPRYRSVLYAMVALIAVLTNSVTPAVVPLTIITTNLTSVLVAHYALIVVDAVPALDAMAGFQKCASVVYCALNAAHVVALVVVASWMRP